MTMVKYSEANKICSIKDTEYGFYNMYSSKSLWCGVCKEKSVTLNGYTFMKRSEILDASRSKKSNEEKIIIYNKKHKMTDSDYWLCRNERCNLFSNDKRLGYVNVFRKKKLMMKYNPVIEHNFF